MAKVASSVARGLFLEAPVITGLGKLFCFPFLAPVVQRLDNAIHRINRYPADKCQQNKPRYPLDSDLSGG